MIVLGRILAGGPCLLYAEVFIIILISSNLPLISLAFRYGNQITLLVIGISLQGAEIQIAFLIGHFTLYRVTILIEGIDNGSGSHISALVCKLRTYRELAIGIFIIISVIVDLTVPIAVIMRLRQIAVHIISIGLGNDASGLHCRHHFNTLQQVPLGIIFIAIGCGAIGIGFATPSHIAVTVKIQLCVNGRFLSAINVYRGRIGLIIAIRSAGIKNGTITDHIHFYVSCPGCRCHTAHQCAQHQHAGQYLVHCVFLLISFELFVFQQL